MGCCGDKRARLVRAATRRESRETPEATVDAPPPRDRGVRTFEFIGNGTLSVRGAGSSRTYRFAFPGTARGRGRRRGGDDGGARRPVRGLTIVAGCDAGQQENQRAGGEGGSPKPKPKEPAMTRIASLIAAAAFATGLGIASAQAAVAPTASTAAAANALAMGPGPDWCAAPETSTGTEASRADQRLRKGGEPLLTPRLPLPRNAWCAGRRITPIGLGPAPPATSILTVLGCIRIPYACHTRSIRRGIRVNLCPRSRSLRRPPTTPPAPARAPAARCRGRRGYPEKRLAAFASDRSQRPSQRSEADGVLRIYQQRTQALDMLAEIRSPEVILLGVLMLVPEVPHGS